MAILNFPANPSVDDTYEENGVLYTWDGEKWVATSSSNYLPITGGELTGDLTVPSLNGGPLAGFRNQIINGAFVWNQRGKGTYATDREYTVDRWQLVAAPGIVGQIGHAFASADSGFIYAITNPSTNDVYAAQPIEIGTGKSGIFYKGSVWTLSFYSPLATSEYCSAAFVDTSANETNQVVVTQQNSTVSASTVISNYYRHQITFTIGVSPAITNTSLRVSIKLAPGNSITGVQLEPGLVATPFEHRPIGTELALCQRYYQKLDSLRLYCVAPGDSVNSRFLNGPRPVVMRTTPTSTGTASAGTINISDTAESIVITSSSVSNASTGVTITNYTADAEL